MNVKPKCYPVALIEDRYSGTYSGGRWLAVAEADAIGRMRAVWNGAGGSDDDAITWWEDAPDWLAVGDTPDAALAALYAKHGGDDGL